VIQLSKQYNYEDKYPKAIRRRTNEIESLIRGPGVKEVYRQTKENGIGTWNFPRALQNNGNWRRIKNSRFVITTRKDGSLYTVFAIWRMWEIKHKVKDKEGRRLWDAKIYATRTKRHTFYYLICRKIPKDISGIF